MCHSRCIWPRISLPRIPSHPRRELDHIDNMAQDGAGAGAPDFEPTIPGFSDYTLYFAVGMLVLNFVGIV